MHLLHIQRIKKTFPHSLSLSTQRNHLLLIFIDVHSIPHLDRTVLPVLDDLPSAVVVVVVAPSEIGVVVAVVADYGCVYLLRHQQRHHHHRVVALVGTQRVQLEVLELAGVTSIGQFPLINQVPISIPGEDIIME